LPFTIRVSARALSSVFHAHERWRASHGTAPSRLESELVDTFARLASHPYLGTAYRSGAERRKLRIETGYFVIYRIQPRNRVITIVQLLHESELYR